MKTALPYRCSMVVAAPLTLIGLVAAGCRRAPPSPAPDAGRDAPSAASLAPPPGAPHHITHSAAFAVDDVSLQIEDIHMSKRLDATLARASAEVVVNGGFFGDDGEPVGLVVSEGRALGRFSPQMSGGVLWAGDGRLHLSSTEDYREPPAPFAVPFAIQCRPRLVVGSHMNIKSDDGRRAARTTVCLRDGGKSFEVAIAESDHGDGGPTLFQLAGELLARGCEEALNLDGGPSTGWAEAHDGGLVFRPPAAPVRHALVVARKKK